MCANIINACAPNIKISIAPFRSFWTQAQSISTWVLVYAVRIHFLKYVAKQPTAAFFTSVRKRSYIICDCGCHRNMRPQQTKSDVSRWIFRQLCLLVITRLRVLSILSFCYTEFVTATRDLWCPEHLYSV